MPTASFSINIGTNKTGSYEEIKLTIEVAGSGKKNHASSDALRESAQEWVDHGTFSELLGEVIDKACEVNDDQ